MISRRRFLQMSALTFTYPGMLTGCGKSVSLNQNHDLILGGGRYQLEANGPIQYAFSMVNMTTGSVARVAMDFLSHGIHQHPHAPERIVIFQKKGPYACELDLKKQAVTRPIGTDKSRHFYGHGAYSADGKTLYCTEAYLHSYDGIIAVRDADTLEFLGEFPSYGKEPHECKLIDGGRVMVVTNGGGKLGEDAPCVTYIDTASHKLLERVPLTNDRLNTGHLSIAEDGSLVVVSAPRAGLDKSQLGGVSIRPSGGTMESLSQPQKVTHSMVGEALSVVIANDAGIAAVTHPDGGMVTFWSIQDRSLRKRLTLPYPRGVNLTLDKKTFIVSYGANPKLVKVSVATLEVMSKTEIDNTFISGSHIYNWSRGIPELQAPAVIS